MLELSINQQINLAVGFAVIFGVGLYLLYLHSKLHTIPRKWRRVGVLSKINIVPIKSCAPLTLDASASAICDIFGLRHESAYDRALMLIDQENQSVSGYTYPNMVLIRTKVLSPTTISITAPNMEPLELDYAELEERSENKEEFTPVFGADKDALLCGEKYDKWFSKFILDEESGLRLVYSPSGKLGKPVITPVEDESYVSTEELGIFDNSTSYLLINLSSIDDLNKRLTKPVESLQFRGSFEVKLDTDEPYSEDHWRWVRIGQWNVFRVLGPCTHGRFTNTNINTGKRSANGEPIKTLRSYRMRKDSAGPAMGIKIGMWGPGVMNINDVIWVEDHS